MISLHDTFLNVKKHLLGQGERAQKANGTCMYKTEDGLSCAVGCLLTDITYNKVFEGESVDDPRVLQALCKEGYPTEKEACDLYLELQHIHDALPIDTWEEKLDKLEKETFG